MAHTYSEDGKKKTRENKGTCPSGFYRDPISGKCVQSGVGSEYKP